MSSDMHVEVDELLVQDFALEATLTPELTRKHADLPGAPKSRKVIDLTAKWSTWAREAMQMQAPPRFDNFPLTPTHSLVSSELDDLCDGSDGSDGSIRSVTLSPSSGWPGESPCSDDGDPPPVYKLEHGILPNSDVVVMPLKARFDPNTAAARLSALCRRDGNSPAAHWTKFDQLPLGIKAQHRRAAVMELYDMRYTWFDEVLYFPKEARWLAVKLLSLYIADHSLLPLSKQEREEKLAWIMTACFSLAIKVCIDSHAPLYFNGLTPLFDLMPGHPTIQDFKALEFDICRSPRIDWCLWTPTPWHFLEELCYVVPTLRTLAGRGEQMWQDMNDNLATEIERSTYAQTFLTFTSAQLAAVALYVAVEVAYAPSPLDECVSNTADHEILLARLKEEVCEALHLREIDFLACLALQYYLEDA